MKLSSLAKKRIIAGMAALIVVIAFYLYSEMSIKKQVQPVKVAYTRVDIPPHTKITADMLFERIVPAQSVPPNAVTDVNSLIGKWTVEGYGISKNSLVYQGKVLDTNAMPDSAILKLEENEYAFPILVDLETSSGNAIIPDTFVDLYFVTDQTESRKPLSGKLFERVRVTSVKDNRTRNVFGAGNYTEAPGNGNQQNIATTTDDPTAVAKLYTLAVTEEQLNVLNKAKILGNIIPVANGNSYEPTLNTANRENITSTEVQEYIAFNSYDQGIASEEGLLEKDENATTKPKDEATKNTDELTNKNVNQEKGNEQAKDKVALNNNQEEQENVK